MGKPWPSDAVVCMCVPAAEARIDNMRSVEAVACRDCGAGLVWDGETARAAVPDSIRRGRPFAFLCIPCGVKYDRPPLLIDFRAPARGE